MGALQNWKLALEPTRLIELAVSIVTARADNNHVSVADLPDLIKSVHQALGKLTEVPAAVEPERTPVVSIKASVKPEFIACLDCGKKQSMLKRHLQTAHQLTPTAYRERWHLPASYPMVAPLYSARRSDIAKALGLGRKPGAQPRAMGARRGKLSLKS